MRLWWFHVAVAVGLSISVGISLVTAGRWYVALYLLTVLAFAFQGGIFYGERLRRLGKRGRWVPRPVDDASR